MDWGPLDIMIVLLRTWGLTPKYVIKVKKWAQITLYYFLIDRFLYSEKYIHWLEGGMMIPLNINKFGGRQAPLKWDFSKLFWSLRYLKSQNFPAWRPYINILLYNTSRPRLLRNAQDKKIFIIILLIYNNRSLGH